MGRKRRKGKAGMLPEVAAPSRGVPRRLRVERDLHERLAVALRHLRDNRVNGAVITRVELTDDLAFARIYVRSPLDQDVEPKALIHTLKLASSRLRREVGRGMALRKAPELRFIHDSGLEAAERVEALLEEIRQDDEVETDDGLEDGDTPRSEAPAEPAGIASEP